MRPRAHSAHPVGWEGLAEAAAKATSYVEHSKQTRLTDPNDDLTALAAEIAARNESPCEAALEICSVIGEQMQYVQGVTHVHSTAKDSWADKRGVCQDIAHIALGALRSVGIPARYVSGYLHPKPNAEIGETVAGSRTRGSSGSAANGEASTPRTRSTSETVT